MKKEPHVYLIFLVAGMVSLGILFLSTLSAPMSMKYFDNTTYYLFHQLLYGLGPALVLGIFAYKMPLSFLQKIAPALVFANLLVLVLVFFLGLEFWGAQRWLSLGKATIQPSEFLKITAILYLSALLSSRMAGNKEWKRQPLFVPFIIFLGIIAVILILQPDVSTLGIISLTLLAVYFCAGSPLWHSLIVVGAGLSALYALIKFEPYRLERLLVFLRPETDPLGIGFQVKQSLIAIGSGGFFGKGIGMSSQKFGFLPAAMTDSVFAVIGEETGILGGIIVVLLFAAFFWLGFKIAANCKNKFGQLTALGITFWISIQAIINISSAMGIFPLSGIPLPFFSYGGSHLATELIGVGLLLNISKHS